MAAQILCMVAATRNGYKITTGQYRIHMLLCLPGLQFRVGQTTIPYLHIAVIVVRKYVSNFKDDEEPNI